MGGKRSGRRPRYSAEVHERIVMCLKAGAFKVHAAEAAGVSVDALDEWLRLGREGDKRYTALYFDVEQAQGQFAMRLLTVITKAAAAGDWKAAAWHLERRFPDIYGRAAQTAVGVSIGGHALSGGENAGDDQQPQTRVVFYLPDNGRRPPELADGS